MTENKKMIITKSKNLIKILNNSGFNGFVDSTSKNDLTESVYNEKLELQIFLPNSENDNLENEQWSTFSINENEIFIQDLDLLIEKWNPILNLLNSIGCNWE